MSELPGAPLALSPLQRRAQKMARQIGWKLEFSKGRARILERSRVIMEWSPLSRIVQRMRVEAEFRQRAAGAEDEV
jgi:hypothetical protein